MIPRKTEREFFSKYKSALAASTFAAIFPNTKIRRTTISWKREASSRAANYIFLARNLGTDEEHSAN